MASSYVSPFGSVTVAIPAAQSIAVFTRGTAQVSRITGYPNYPETISLLGTVANSPVIGGGFGQTVFGPYATGAQIRIDNGAVSTSYVVGTNPTVEEMMITRIQIPATAIDVTGGISLTAIMNGLITSTTAAAVAGTLPTGGVLDASNSFLTSESFDWSVVNTGGVNAFTVTGASGHSVIGNAVVAASSSGTFRTRRGTVLSYNTYRIG